MKNINEIVCGMSYKVLIDNFLDEDKLAEYLKLFFPNNAFIRNKAYPNNKFRPDFRCDDLKMIIEFDGDRHYTKAKSIIDDELKDNIMIKDGYKVIRIPNFVQLDTKVIKFLFDINFEFKQIFPHGFISKEVTLPADFCELGITRFIKDLIKFYFIAGDIIKSLNAKIENLNDIRLVLPLKIIKGL